MSEIALSEDEIIEITRYKRPSLQIQFLKSIGIDARIRRDNTVFVNRFEYMAAANQKLPKQQSAPKLKSLRR